MGDNGSTPSDLSQKYNLAIDRVHIHYNWKEIVSIWKHETFETTQFVREIICLRVSELTQLKLSIIIMLIHGHGC